MKCHCWQVLTFYFLKHSQKLLNLKYNSMWQAQNQMIQGEKQTQYSQIVQKE